MWFLSPPVYESRAKLLVRYVLDRSAVDPIDGANAASSGRSMDSIIGAEIEILTSWDLAVQVAQAIGPKQLLPRSGAGATEEEAARAVSSSLKVVSTLGSSIISVSYSHRDPEVARRVLEELISRYFIKHLEVHRSAGAFDFVTEQIDQVRTRLVQAEEALKPLRDRAGVVSLKESRASLSSEAAKIETQLHTAEVELAEQHARVSQMLEGAQPSTSSTMPSGTPSEEEDLTSSGPVIEVSQVSKESIQQYQTLILRLEKLRKAEADLLTKYVPGSQRMRVNQRQIRALEEEKLDLEGRFPDISAKAATMGATTGPKVSVWISCLRELGLRG